MMEGGCVGAGYRNAPLTCSTGILPIRVHPEINDEHFIQFFID